MRSIVATLCLPLFGSLINARSHPGVYQRQQTCMVRSEGYETIDDAPAINAAIEQCSAGTIVLPQNELYSIRSPINFSACNGCEVQLEGQLWLSNDPSLFANQSAFIAMSGVSNARLTSLTGMGLIDGRATEAYQRYRSGGDASYTTAPPMINVANSTNIVVDRILAKNVIKRFYMVDAGSSNVKLTNLNLTVENQWYQDIWTKAESIGFHIRNSSNVEINNVNVDFNSDRYGYKVGVCAGIDISTSNIYIRNISCQTSAGAMIQFGTGSLMSSVPPKPEGQFAENIKIENLTSNCTDHTGFLNLLGYNNQYVRNFTYDGVTILPKAEGSNAYTAVLLNNLCYLVPHAVTGACSSFYTHDLRASFSDIWFKNYHGYQVGKPELGCFNENCTCDFHFEGWPTQTKIE